jgi:hypothetical protein
MTTPAYTTPVYPAAFPLPDHGPYYGVMDFGILRSSTPTAEASQIKISNAMRPELSLTFSMDNSTYLTWWNWVKEYAYTWFMLESVNPHLPTYITSERRIRFTGDLQYRKVGDNWLSITVPAELYIGDNDDPQDPLRIFDQIDAGSASSPSTDIIDSGEPSSPSDPNSTVRAELYYYGY